MAEALKQLLFPMVWQNFYILPGNENIVDKATGIMICIYGSDPMVHGYDFFDMYDDSSQPPRAICDIDACYTNNLPLPQLPDEQMYIRVLNTLKNTRIN